MRVTNYPDGAALLARARHFLEANEAENNLQLGICAGLSAPEPGARGHYLATVEDDAGAIVAVATWTPPHNLVISRAPAAALAPLLSDLRAWGASLPGVLAPDLTAEAFAALWSQDGGGTWRAAMRERIYRLTSVVPPARVSGRLREASPSDLDILAGWIGGFLADAGLAPISDAAGRSMAERRIEERSLFVWEDGAPASMAATVGPTSHGVRINLVYTPRELRRRGYASACVAALSQRMLDSGRALCFLYADLANPTSNGIYQRIGYEGVADVTMIKFAG